MKHLISRLAFVVVLFGSATAQAQYGQVPPTPTADVPMSPGQSPAPYNPAPYNPAPCNPAPSRCAELHARADRPRLHSGALQSSSVQSGTLFAGAGWSTFLYPRAGRASVVRRASVVYASPVFAVALRSAVVHSSANIHPGALYASAGWPARLYARSFHSG